MSLDRRDTRQIDDQHNWEYGEPRERESDRESERDDGQEVRYVDRDRGRYEDRELHRSSMAERAHRGIPRERELHAMHDTDLERNLLSRQLGHNSEQIGHGPTEEYHHSRLDASRGHEEATRDFRGNEGTSRNIRRHEGGSKNIRRQEGVSRSRGSRRSLYVRSDGSHQETEHRDFERESELRKRGSRDFPREDGLREPPRSSHDKSRPEISTIHRIDEDSPLPPTPTKLPTPPESLDFPMDGTHPEYGPHDPDDHDPRLRAELYPLEGNISKAKPRPDVSAHGSHMNIISAETFAHHSRSRHGEPHHRLHESQGIHRASGRMSRVQEHGENIDFHEGTRREIKRGDSLRRKSVTESKISTKKLHGYSILREEETPIERHASVLLPVLEDSEKIFHELVAAGDVAATRDFLMDHPDFNINCVNYQKISALHVAVREQNEAMVEFLLEQKNLDISDCALYAIKGGNFKIVEMILERIHQVSPRLEFAGTTHSADFADDLTPIVLAAQLGNYEIIDFLIKRGHSIPPVHPPFCKCEACKADLKKYDRLRYSTMKLNLYKAICNPMYIFHTTDDPFQRAFELVKELQDAATVFPQFKVSFEELWHSLRTFTTELVGCCRNAQEVEIILKKSPKSVADHVKFPRLEYAIDLKQKEFVSHPYTQAVLGDAWTGDLLEWKIRSPLMQSLSVFPRIPMLPIMTIMCIVMPNHSWVRKWKTPVNKMISSVASYLIFLIILFLESNLDKKNQKRGPPNSGLEGVIIIYVIGYIWLNIRTCFKQGIKRFFSTMWHWYDTIMLFLFTMTIIFWIASWVDITANGDIDLPRKYWNALDPELIAEGFFAAAVIMAFFRLNLFLSLNYHLGPLQVSIGKMMLDIFRFIIIFFIIILAWCAGLCRFYQPYDGMVQKDAASGNTTTQVSSFVSFLMTLKTFFWAIFGMSPIESADVVIENLPGDTPGTTIINKHQFTETVGYIAFALFQFLSVVVVLNMLVACMANTFTKVIDNVTVEWVFGRSQIYLSFMASSILPPPFNLVPTASGVKDMCRWFRLLAKPSDGQRAKCSLTHCCYIESETEAYVNSEFPSLMSELAQRYIRLKSETHEEESNDLDEIRNEINEIKESLRKLTASSFYRRS